MVAGEYSKPVVPAHLVIGTGDNTPVSVSRQFTASRNGTSVSPVSRTREAMMFPEWMKDTKHPLSLSRMPLIEYAFENIRWSEEQFLHDPSLLRYLHDGTTPLPFLVTPQEVVREDNQLFRIGEQYIHQDFPKPMTLYAFIPGWTYEFPVKNSVMTKVKRTPKIMGIFSSLPLTSLLDSDGKTRAKTLDAYVVTPIASTRPLTP